LLSSHSPDAVHRRSGSQPARGGWPLRSYLELGALPGAVPCARLHARQLLLEWGFPDHAADAELLVSELATDAVRSSAQHETAAPVRLWVLSDTATLLVLVGDACTQPPVLLQAAMDEENGRGLLLVNALSDRWGWYVPDGTGGKITWFEISLRTARRRGHGTGA
jgi:anti-sigma regulatory factor (Ser/Thr protein kinase)